MVEGALCSVPRRRRTGIDVFDEDDAWDVIEDIPNDSAAALILIEHHLGGPIAGRDREGGWFSHLRRLHQPAGPRGRSASSSAEEAAELHALEAAGTAGLMAASRTDHAERNGGERMMGSRRVARRTSRRVARRR